MNKVHIPINWENFPEKGTPINAENLNKMDAAIGTLDDRVLQLNSDVKKKVEKINGNIPDATGNVEITDYYKKTETYTQEEVNSLVSTIPKFSIEVVTVLPTTGISSTTIYLLKTENEGQNLYEEYIHVNGYWEFLGSQGVDLTGYATEDFVREYSQPKGNYALKDDLKNLTTVQIITWESGD